MMRSQEAEGSSGSTRCQDCGNQAKKDCVYLRCRTCCKSRGFQCQTHVKSTWVPVSKRRQRHQQQLAAIQQHHHHHHHHQQLVGPHPKRYRENLSLGFAEGNFPAEVSLPAVFNCVRVSSMDNVVDQYAYQTSVNIGGHNFKGILYDQGPDTQYASAGESSSGGLPPPLQQQAANFMTAGGGGASTSGAASSPPSYPSPFSAFMPGTPFFQYPKS